MAGEFEKMTLVQLKTAAKEAGLQFPAAIKKAELMALLEENAGKNAVEQTGETVQNEGVAEEKRLTKENIIYLVFSQFYFLQHASSWLAYQTCVTAVMMPDH